MSRYADQRFRELRVVYVITKTGGTVRGVLREMYDDALLLTNAAIADDVEGQPGKITWTKADGDMVIPIGNVDYFLDGLSALALEG